MAVSIPDPDKFGESGPKPHDKIDKREYHKLTDFEEEEDNASP